MSNTRHEPDVRGYAVTHPPGRVRLPTGAGWDQLLYAESGSMTVTTSAGSWTLPPHRALWVPDGAPSHASNRFPVAVRSLYFAVGLHAAPAEARTVRVTPLVRELMLHAVRTCPLDLANPLDEALLRVLLDQLERLPEATLWLPEPALPQLDPQILRDWTRSLPSITRDAGTSLRTLERACVASTGMSLGAWRRRARILDSLHLLAAGRSVTETAVSVGYGSPSAFVTAFRAELGQTPRHYLR